MRLSTSASLLLAAGTTSAFHDASPFMFFSTSELLFSSPAIATSSSVLENVRDELSKCPSNIYVVAHQPGASSADYGSEGATPHLKSWVRGKDKTIKSSYAVSEVVGAIEPSVLQKTLEDGCGAGSMQIDASTGSFHIVDNAQPRVIRVDFPALPAGSGRRIALRENDLFLSNLVEMLPTTKYTVLYTTSPGAQHSRHVEEHKHYQMDHHMNPLVHAELKRDAPMHARASNDSNALPDGPLFERYQFFTPAIFMGFITMVFLFTIIFVAVRAIAGLEVTYGAFEKQMGPNSQQKKAQ